MTQSTMDSFTHTMSRVIHIYQDPSEAIKCSILQKMTDEEAEHVVQCRKIELITSSQTISGYWHVGKSREKFSVLKTPQFGMTETRSFISKVAAAIYISQKVGDPMMCRAISENFPEDSEAQILTNLRVPPQIVNGKESASKWRSKSTKLLGNASRSTKERNIRGREHDKVNWNDINEFRKWMADELEKSGFRCYYSGLKLTLETISLERIDQNKGYNSTNCKFIDIHFQVGHCQWTREKIQNVYHLRNANVEMKYGTDFFKRLEISVIGCNRRTIKRNHPQNEVTVKKLIEQYIKQKGRCHYLNIPLMIDGDWQISVERLDETKGYVDGNWVLVTLETQNPFIQWTKEFVGSVWERKPQFFMSEEVLLDKYHEYNNRSIMAIAARKRTEWSEEEENIITELINEYGTEPVPDRIWIELLPQFNDRSVNACKERRRIIQRRLEEALS